MVFVEVNICTAAKLKKCRSEIFCLPQRDFLDDAAKFFLMTLIGASIKAKLAIKFGMTKLFFENVP